MNDLEFLRVLYVEDDDATREALSSFLKSRVGKVYTASSGEEGIQKFNELKPNLLIADLIMPGMSGMEMINEIRTTGRECRIMIISTVSELDTVLYAVDYGIDHYILKPIDTDDLVNKLESTAKSIKRKSSHSTIANLVNMNTFEDSIRKEFIKLLKSYLGKGPQDLKVLVVDNEVEFTAMDAVTVMEKTITANKRNIAVMEQFRKLFYNEISRPLEDCLEELTGYKAEVTSIKVDGAKRVDKIILTIHV